MAQGKTSTLSTMNTSIISGRGIILQLISSWHAQWSSFRNLILWVTRLRTIFLPAQLRGPRPCRPTWEGRLELRNRCTWVRSLYCIGDCEMWGKGLCLLRLHVQWGWFGHSCHCQCPSHLLASKKYLRLRYVSKWEVQHLWSCTACFHLQLIINQIKPSLSNVWPQLTFNLNIYKVSWIPLLVT